MIRDAGRPPRAHHTNRWRRPLLLGVIGGLLGLIVMRIVSYASQPDAVAALVTNADHRIYMDAAERIRSGGPLYPAWQLAGPYGLDQMPELYPPPTMLFLVVPMSYLPHILWWAVPLTIIAVVVWQWRPSLLGWAGILACFAPPWAWDGVLAGGLFMWIAAFVALGTRWPAFYAGVFLKPSLFPFGLIGLRSRSWWAAILAAAAISLALIPAWLDYAQVMSNLTGAGLLYSIHNVPLILIPIVAWLTRRRSLANRGSSGSGSSAFQDCVHATATVAFP